METLLQNCIKLIRDLPSAVKFSAENFCQSETLLKIIAKYLNVSHCQSVTENRMPYSA
jgi:hypothetical protein